MSVPENIGASHRNLSEPLVVSSLAILATVFFLAAMDRSVNPYDESIVLVGALRVLAGEVPHRDFTANYGPAQFYVVAGLFRLFGISVLVERFWDILIRVVTVVLLYNILHRVVPRRFAFWNAVMGAAWLGYIQSSGYPLIPSFTLSLASLALVSRGIWQRLSSPLLFSGGLCIGFSFAFRYDVGLANFVCIAIAVSAGVWFCSDESKNKIQDALRLLSWLATGFGAVVVPLVICLVFQGAIADLLFQIVVFPAKNYVRMRSLPFPEIDFHSDIFVYLPFLIGIVGSIVLVGIFYRQIVQIRAKREVGGRVFKLHFSEWLMLSMILLMGVFIAKGTVRVSLIHLSPAIVLALSIMTILNRMLAPRRNALTILVSGILSAVFFLSLAFVGKVLALDLPHAVLSERAGPTSHTPPIPVSPTGGLCPMIKDFEQLACFDISPDILATANTLREMTLPQDRIFVGLPHHDKIFVNDLLLYFVAQRLPATKWHHFDPGLQTSRPIQQQIIEELQRDHIRVVVLVDRWENVSEPNESSTRSGVRLLDDYIRSAYHPVVTYGAYTILNRN